MSTPKFGANRYGPYHPNKLRFIDENGFKYEHYSLNSHTPEIGDSVFICKRNTLPFGAKGWHYEIYPYVVQPRGAFNPSAELWLTHNRNIVIRVKNFTPFVPAKQYRKFYGSLYRRGF